MHPRCVSKTDGKHFPRGGLGVQELKIESTAGEMFWKEKNSVFCAFIANIWLEKNKNDLEL